MDEMEAFRERFWGGIDVRGSDDCWLYVGQPKVEYPDDDPALQQCREDGR